MKNKTFQFRVKKKGDEWMVVFSHKEGFCGAIPHASKYDAYELVRLINYIYELGRTDEFKANIAKTKKMMDKFGL